MKILLAIDDSDCSQAAVETVSRQFVPADSEVHVLHVDEWPKGMPTSVAFAEGPAAARAIVAAREEVRARAKELVARAAQQLGAARFRVTVDVREGDARKEILDAAEDWRPDLIVMGSHGRRGVERFVLGSVSEYVMRRAACSVQVVRTGDVPAAA